nr:putative G protein [Aksy-Durug Melophagus sigmavirus]
MTLVTIYSFINILNILTNMSPQVSGHLYPLPSETPWLKLNPDNLRCPNSLRSNNIKNLTLPNTYKIDVISPLSHPTMSGHICRKARITSSCSETWYFYQTSTVSTCYLPVSTYECKEAISNFINQPSKIFNPPILTCDWNKDNSISHEEYIIEHHPVLYDPYHNKFIDPIFPTGQSQINDSQTVFENTLWLPNGDITLEMCAKSMSEKAYLVGKQDQPELLIPGYSILDLSSSCRFKYCKNYGIRFKNGVWIGIADLVSYLELSSNFQINLCDETTPIRTKALEKLAVSTTIDIVLLLRCQDVISKLINNDKITPNDLSFLTPAHPGLFPSFLIKDQQLYSKLSHYVEIDLSNLNHKENLVGTTLDGKEIFETHWEVLSDVNNTFISQNGFIKINNSIIPPLSYNLIETYKLELWTELKLDKFQQNEKLSRKKIPLTVNNGTQTITQLETASEIITDIETTITSFLPDFSSRIRELSILLLFIIILIIICIIIKKKSTSNNQRHISLRTELNPQNKDQSSFESMFD